MFKLIGKALGILLALIIVFVAATSILALTRWKRTFASPMPGIHASADSAVVAHGRQLAYGDAACVTCHVTKDELLQVREGAMPPLAGGQLFEFPLGKFYTPNLTPDGETGIGRYSDGELARVLRNSVRPDGRAVLPFMEYHNVSDDDLTALISFLRSQEPVRREVPAHQPSMLGKAVFAFAIKPIGPTGTPPASSPSGLSVERGAYLASNLSACVGCHTSRNHMDGAAISLPFAGGMKFPDETDPTATFVSPNLTPATDTPFAGWDENRFVDRFRSGVGLPNSPMPWRSYQRMSEDDIRSIFRYLRTLEPSNVPIGPTYLKGEA